MLRTWLNRTILLDKREWEKKRFRIKVRWKELLNKIEMTFAKKKIILTNLSWIKIKLNLKINYKKLGSIWKVSIFLHMIWGKRSHSWISITEDNFSSKRNLTHKKKDFPIWKRSRFRPYNHWKIMIRKWTTCSK